MAIVDLKSAYQSVHIRPMEHAITGLQWKFHNDSDPIIMCDTRLPFGAGKSPAIFNWITQAVARSLRRNGHHVVVYLEDFFVCGPDFDSCKSTFDTLIMTLCGLGFQINWNKIVPPTQQLVFRDVQIDTVAGLLSLKAGKLSDLVDLLDSFEQRKHAAHNQLESVAGKLCWAAHVVPWGWAYIGTIFNLIFSLKSPKHKCRLGDLQANLNWWRQWLICGLNWRRIWPHVSWSMFMLILVPKLAELSAMAKGFMCIGPLMYPVLTPSYQYQGTRHSNHGCPGVVPYLGLSPCGDSHRYNKMMEAVINNGTAQNSTRLDLLKHFASLAFQFNFTISASYMPGVDNIMADTISRLHEPG